MAMNPRLLVPRASGLFDPKTISGLNLWLDFSDSTTITLDANNLIQQITDKSGNSQTGTQGTASARPAVGTLNGRNVGDWGSSTNVKHLLYSAGANTSNWREVAIVAVWDGGGSTFPDFNGLMTASVASGTTSGIGLLGTGSSANWDTSFGWHTSRAVNNVATAVAFPTITSPFVVQFWRSSDVGVNGYRLGTDRDQPNRGWRGRIAEVVSYNRALTDAERSTICKGLASKWKVTL